MFYAGAWDERPLAGGRTGDGRPLDPVASGPVFEFTQRAYEWEEAAISLRILPDSEHGDVVDQLTHISEDAS